MSLNIAKQQGTSLIIALLILLVITVLAVGGMRSVTLESRITANRAIASQQESLANAALREAEFRFFGPAFLRDKLEPNSANCTKANQLRGGAAVGNNKPCLIEELAQNQLNSFFRQPLAFLKAGSNDCNDTLPYTACTAQSISAVDSDTQIAWMPYRGLDADKPFEGSGAYWNSYRILDGAAESQVFNAQSGDALEGRGTYFYLLNGQADDQVAVQSTLAVIYLGLNP